MASNSTFGDITRLSTQNIRINQKPDKTNSGSSELFLSVLNSIQEKDDSTPKDDTNNVEQDTAIVEDIKNYPILEEPTEPQILLSEIIYYDAEDKQDLQPDAAEDSLVEEELIESLRLQIMPPLEHEANDNQIVTVLLPHNVMEEAHILDSASENIVIESKMTPINLQFFDTKQFDIKIEPLSSNAGADFFQDPKIGLVFADTNKLQSSHDALHKSIDPVIQIETELNLSVSTENKDMQMPEIKIEPLLSEKNPILLVSSKALTSKVNDMQTQDQYNLQLDENLTASLPDFDYAISLKGHSNRHEFITPSKTSDQIADALKPIIISSKNHITISLYPEALGTVDVRIDYEKDKGSGIVAIKNIKIIAEKKDTLELLERSQSDLKKALSEIVKTQEGFLQFGMKKEDQSNNGNGSYFKDQEERQNWMNKFSDTQTDDSESSEDVEQDNLIKHKIGTVDMQA